MRVLRRSPTKTGARATIGRMFCPQAVDWDGVRAWIQTIATIVGGGIAAYGLWWTVSRQLREKRFEQSKGVYAWIHKDGQQFELRVGNRSELPVYNAFFYYMVRPDATDGNEWEQLEAHLAKESTSAVLASGPFVPAVRVLPPGDFVVSAELMGVTGGRHDFSDQMGVDVVFTDASGRHWTRRARGKLEESSKNPVDLPRLQAVLHAFGMAPSPWRQLQPVGRKDA